MALEASTPMLTNSNRTEGIDRPRLGKGVFKQVQRQEKSGSGEWDIGMIITHSGSTLVATSFVSGCLRQPANTGLQFNLAKVHDLGEVASTRSTRASIFGIDVKPH